MGKRKQVTGAKKEQKLKRKETPEDVYFAHLDDVKMREKGLGSILIQGIEWPEEEEDEGGECLPLTVEQLAILRYVIINAARKKKLIPGTNIITDGQGDQGGSIMWNTHTGNQAIFGALDEIKKIKRMKKYADRFDSLFALTNPMLEYGDMVFNDNECYGSPGCKLEEIFKELSRQWIFLIKKNDATLGIDPEFTRPGVLSLLKQIKALTV